MNVRSSIIQNNDGQNRLSFLKQNKLLIKAFQNCVHRLLFTLWKDCVFPYIQVIPIGSSVLLENNNRTTVTDCNFFHENPPLI